MIRPLRLLTAATLLLHLASGAGHTQENPDPSVMMPPMGLGSLKQEQISITIANDQLTVRFEPLNEQLLRLLAPDAYRALSGLIARNRAAIDSISRDAGASQPGLMLLTVYANTPDARFDPTLVGVTVNTRRIEPIGILPLDANFNRQQLAVRTVGMGLFVFSEPLPVYSTLVFSYGSVAAEGWASMIPTFDRELARVSARARSQATQQAQPQPAPANKPDSAPPQQ